MVITIKHSENIGQNKSQIKVIKASKRIPLKEVAEIISYKKKTCQVHLIYKTFESLGCDFYFVCSF